MDSRLVVAIVAIIVIVIAVALALGGGGGQETATPAAGQQTTTPGETLTTVEWAADGTISPGEYDAEVDLADGSMKLYLRVDGEYVYIAIAGKTTGWVAIGIEPTYKMKDADMIIGWVADNGTVFVFDAYSTGATGPHPPDEKLGGTNDILEYGGAEKDGWTIIEVKRKIDTGDKYDKPLNPGSTVKIIYAMSTKDDFKAIHDIVRGSAEVTIPGG